MDKHNIDIPLNNAAYDKWFRTQVQTALDDAAPGITNEDVKQKFFARRAILQQRIERAWRVSIHRI
jgi:hypothetical protein